MLFLVSQFQISIWGVDCSLYGGIGLPFLHRLPGDPGLEINVNISSVGTYR